MALPEEPEKPPNHERWIISYADFTTLLLATFVVMYAVSSINSSKFQEMAEAFNTAFMGRTATIAGSGFAAGQKAPFNFMPSPVHVPIITRKVVPDRELPVSAVQDEPEHAKPTGKPEDSPNTPFAPARIEPKDAATENPPPAFQRAIDEPAVPPPGWQPGQKGTGPSTGQDAKPPADAPMATSTPPSSAGLQVNPPAETDDLRHQVEQRLQQMDLAYAKLKQALAPLIGTGQVRVSLSSLGVVIDINEVLLFTSGKAELTSQALPLIDRVAGILKGLPYQIQVNGFTDTVPIHSAQFDSNWDLSAVRAVSVVKRFVLAGVDPAQLVGAGFGEFHPIANNTTPEGKSANRRVSVVVVSPIQGDNPMRTPLLGSPAGRAPLSTAASAGTISPTSVPQNAAAPPLLP